MLDFVRIHHTPALKHLPPFRPDAPVDVVLPLAAYDADLGMRTRSEVHRQLERDLPRSRVVGDDGTLIQTATAVRARTTHARFCTQAVMAPVVEWFLRSGLMTLEGGRPLEVEVDRRGHIVARKRLRVVRHVGCMSPIGRTTHVDVEVRTTREGVVLVSVDPVSFDPPTARLTSTRARRSPLRTR